MWLRVAKKLKIEKSRKKEKWNILSHTDSFLDSSLMADTHTQIFGNSKIIIDGCIGVYEYKESYLKLRLQKGTVILCGSGFDILCFEGRMITVKGKISSVEFSMVGE